MKDDRGDLDLTKQIQDLNSQNEGLKNLINFQKQEEQKSNDDIPF